VRGPAYGSGTDFGVIRPDWTPRPSYTAMKTLTARLGPEPKVLGWLNLGKGGYGFVFKGKEGDVLAAWAPPGKECKATFAGDVKVTALAGAATPLAAGKELALGDLPVFISGLPAELAKQAQANLGKPYPWGGDYAHATQVSCKLGAVNLEDGLKQVNPKTTVVVNDLAETWRRTSFAFGGEGHYTYFRVDPQFVPYGTTSLEITAVVRRAAPAKPANVGLEYESSKGYTGFKGPNYEVPADAQWHEQTWKLTDANFVGQWGWNFRLTTTGSPGEVDLKEVRVKKAAAPAK
jgi:hypothetical protein